MQAESLQESSLLPPNSFFPKGEEVPYLSSTALSLLYPPKELSYAVSQAVLHHVVEKTDDINGIIVAIQLGPWSVTGWSLIPTDADNTSL